METTCEQNILEFKKKMLNKTSDGGYQIGGKGTVRRKKKNNNIKLSKKKRIKTQIELKIENIIKRINTLITEISDIEEYEMFDAWVQDHILFYIDSISKYELVSKHLLKIIREDPVDFFLSQFAEDIEDEKIVFLSDTDLLLEQFNQSGIEYMLGFYQDIENILVNKKYIEEKQQEDSDVLTTKECYKIMGLDITEDISLKELKLIYRRKALELHPDKHLNETEIYHAKFQSLSKAYKQLLATYNDKII